MGPMHAGGHGRLVAAVAALNVLSFVDRQLLVALAPLLIADLGLTRAQIGLLVGISFMAVYSIGTLVAGFWADHWNRPRLIALGLVVWSLGTLLTATAGGMASLAFWRAFVGIGEAALPATALSMVADRVAPRHLGLATSVFYTGVPVGYALSLALSGAIGPRLGWRACFVALGALGLLGALFVLRMQDPPRRGGAREAGPPLWSTLRERPVILVLTLAGVLLVYTSAASQHTITWLVAERGFDYARAAFASAGVTLVGGLAGNVAIGVITDRARRAHPAGRLLALAGVSAFGLAAALAFYSVPPGSWLFVACWLVAQGFLLGWYGSLVAAVDERAPDGRHASVIGFLLLAVNLLGVASGPYVTGLAGDRLDLTRALQWSVAPGLAGAVLVALVGFVQWRASFAANGA
jgi:MFS transporter, Spinster family, sphingosine-1-phosphate transporter